MKRASLALVLLLTLIVVGVSASEAFASDSLGAIVNVQKTNRALHVLVMLIGVLAGTLSVVGFAAMSAWFQRATKKVDTCGVMYLHGLPGIMGGLAALFVVHGFIRLRN